MGQEYHENVFSVHKPSAIVSCWVQVYSGHEEIRDQRDFFVQTHRRKDIAHPEVIELQPTLILGWNLHSVTVFFPTNFVILLTKKGKFFLFLRLILLNFGFFLAKSSITQNQKIKPWNL